MRDRILRTAGGSYRAVEWDGDNRSGIWPIGDTVLVLPDMPLEKTVGGIHLPDDPKEKLELAAESGVIVAVGDGAFVWTGDRMRKWIGYKPAVGDRVRIERYAGQIAHGNDGRNYRLLTDKCITAAESDASPGIAGEAASPWADRSAPEKGARVVTAGAA